MSVSSSVNITELIDRCPLGPLQIRVIVLCGLVALLDGFDPLAIGVAVPVMAGPPRPHAGCIWAWTDC